MSTPMSFSFGTTKSQITQTAGSKNKQQFAQVRGKKSVTFPEKKKKVCEIWLAYLYEFNFTVMTHSFLLIRFSQFIKHLKCTILNLN